MLFWCYVGANGGGEWEGEELATVQEVEIVDCCA